MSHGGNLELKQTLKEQRNVYRGGQMSMFPGTVGKHELSVLGLSLILDLIAL